MNKPSVILDTSLPLMWISTSFHVYFCCHRLSSSFLMHQKSLLKGKGLKATCIRGIASAWELKLSALLLWMCLWAAMGWYHLQHFRELCGNGISGYSSAIRQMALAWAGVPSLWVAWYSFLACWPHLLSPLSIPELWLSFALATTCPQRSRAFQGSQTFLYLCCSLICHSTYELLSLHLERLCVLGTADPASGLID